jgi:hypothetical protein
MAGFICKTEIRLKVVHRYVHDCTRNKKEKKRNNVVTQKESFLI